jgi:Glutamine amidotransferases class-II
VKRTPLSSLDSHLLEYKRSGRRPFRKKNQLGDVTVVTVQTCSVPQWLLSPRWCTFPSSTVTLFSSHSTQVVRIDATKMKGPASSFAIFILILRHSPVSGFSIFSSAKKTHRLPTLGRREPNDRLPSDSPTALLCQLLGMNCAEPTDFSFSFQGFCKRGGETDIHADGWGLTFYQNKGLRQFHDDQPASQSPLAKFVVNYPIRTLNMISHIRYATHGEGMCNIIDLVCHDFAKQAMFSAFVVAPGTSSAPTV